MSADLQRKSDAADSAAVDLLELAQAWADNKTHVYQFTADAARIVRSAIDAARAAAPAAPQPLTDIHGIVAGAAPAAPEPYIDGWPLYSGLPPAAPAAKPVTLADVLDALNQFNRPKPSEDDGPWEGGHFIRVDHLPDFINIIAAAWFAPAAESPEPLTRLTDEQIDAAVDAWFANSDAEGEPAVAWRVRMAAAFAAAGIGSKP